MIKLPRKDVPISLAKDSDPQREKKRLEPRGFGEYVQDYEAEIMRRLPVLPCPLGFCVFEDKSGRFSYTWSKDVEATDVTALGIIVYSAFETHYSNTSLVLRLNIVGPEQALTVPNLDDRVIKSDQHQEYVARVQYRGFFRWGLLSEICHCANSRRHLTFISLMHNKISRPVLPALEGAINDYLRQAADALAHVQSSDL